MTIDLRTRASDDLLIGAQSLIDSSDLSSPEDVLSFFDKPWKWKTELEDLSIKVRVE